MPVNNIVQLPILEMHRLIEIANETRKLQPLLDAIRHACQEKTNFAPVVQAWSTGKSDFELVTFDEFASFLQEFDFKLPNTEVIKQPDEREVSEVVKNYHAEARELIRQLEEHAATPEFQSERKKLLADYGLFLPARQLAHVLPTYFKGENPGSVIGQYMDQMYAGLKDEASPNFSRYQVTDKHFADTIQEIGKACLQADKSCSVESKTKFVRALNYIVFSCEDESGFDCNQNCGPFFETIEVAPLSLLLKLIWKWGNDAYDCYHLGSLPAFAVLLNRIGMIEPLWEKSGRSLPFRAMNMIHARITDVLHENCMADFKTDDAQFLDAVPKLLDRARAFARRSLGGRSPFTMNAAFAYERWEGYINWNTYDLRLELARALEEAWSTGLHTWDAFERGQPPVDLQDRCDTYMRLFDACEEEGFQHLASAVMAFFVFSQTIAHKGNLGPWHEVAKRVALAAEHPGREMVEQALQVAAAFAYESYPLTELAIRSLLSNARRESASNVVDISTAKAAAMRTRSEFVDAWKERLGPLRWNKLSTKCQRFLVAGDEQWSHNSANFWREDVDFGTIGLDYAKAIEAELAMRLDWLPTSQLYIKHCESLDFKPPKQMTLGSIVETLRGRHPLPDSLRHEIENAGVRCQNDRELMKQLKKLADRRNDAAHTTHEFGPEEYTQLMLLIRKIMPTFVDSLD